MGVVAHDASGGRGYRVAKAVSGFGSEGGGMLGDDGHVGVMVVKVGSGWFW
jgi:hypothetical protein